jgi:SAM-dependent methyltransferase
VCNEADVAFGRRILGPAEVAGQDVLEVGSFHGTGPSLRPYVESLAPATYLGVDIQAGPGVDRIGRVERLTEELGGARFDVVVATELVEHVRDWRAAIRNLKAVLRPGGILLLTTRSAGYPYHGAPSDYWRYETSDMARIFADMEVVAIEPDPSMPGVFVAARGPERSLDTVDLDSVHLLAIATGRRQHDVSTAQVVFHRLRSPRRMAAWLLPSWAKDAARWLASRV